MVSNLLNGWTEIGSAGMIFEVVAGVARETRAAFGLARGDPGVHQFPLVRHDDHRRTELSGLAAARNLLLGVAAVVPARRLLRTGIVEIY